MQTRIDRHAHLEGSLSPAWVKERAAALRAPLPEPLEAFWRGEAQPFPIFIDSFLFVADLINSAEAVRQAVNAAVERLPGAGESPAGIDMWCSPLFLVAERRLLPLDELWKGIEQGIADAKAKGVGIAIILDAVNHFGPQNGHALLDLVGNDLPPFVVGFSTGGLEGVPFREWAPVFDRARGLGLRCAAHAGENGPASNIVEAVKEAQVTRIVHAVRAAAHPEIMEFLAVREIPVDVCITSNLALVPELASHPLKTMMEAGVRCALGTDDPGIIKTDLGNEWQRAETLLRGDSGLLERLLHNSVKDAWCFGGRK